MARLKPRPGPQLDADLAGSYNRASEEGRELLLGIQAARERNRLKYGRPTLRRRAEEETDIKESDDDV